MFKSTQINGAVKCVHGLENSIILKNVWCPKMIYLYIWYNTNQNTINFSIYN